MKSLHLILLLIYVFKCYFSQEEFTFGGASEEEEEDVPQIVFIGVQNNSVTKSEMQYLRVVANVTNFPPSKTNIRWLNSMGEVTASNQNFYIKSLLKKDEGIYNCSVELTDSPDKKFYKALSLKVTIPSISINILPDESLRIGGKVRRQCSDLGLPSETVVDEFTYTWLNPQKKPIGNTNILDIPIVDNSIVGTYTCQYKSKTTSKIYEAETLVDYEDAPKIVFIGVQNNSVTKSEMQYLRVVANVTNFPPSKTNIRWLNSMGEVTASNQNFYIKSLLKKDEGIYNCSVELTDSPDKKFYKALSLKVTIPSLSINILPDESLRIGGKVRRQCSDLGLPSETVVDEFTYTWLNPQKKPIGNTNILDIPIVDNSIVGTYTCQYKSQTTSKIYEAETLVDFKFATDYKITIIPNPSPFQYGERFSLKCDVQPFYKDVKYKWYKNGEFYSLDQEIIFNSFKKENVGLYKCVASVMLPTGKMDLEAESNQQFTMFRNSKIELSEKPGPQIFVHRGEKKELHCEIESTSGLKGSDANWYINNRKFESGIWKNVNRLDRRYVSLLVISDINQENEGKYECRIGNSSKEVNLIVLLDEGIIETSPAVLKVKEGESAEFHCRAENIPNVKNTDLKWSFISKDGSEKYPIPDDNWKLNNPIEAEQTSFIDINISRMSNNGYYICTEPNGRTARSELIVIPNKDKNFLTITPKEIRVRSGQKVEIECFSKNTEGRASGRPMFQFPNNKPVSRDSRFVVSNVGPARIRLTAPAGLSLSDNNMDVICVNEHDKVTSKIYVKDVCPPGFRYCQNGQCLENAKFCDKNKDCADGSDENPISCRECDPISRKCETFNNEIPKKNYFLLHWTCDGEEDCGNGFDETNCGDFSLNNCGGKYFKCSDNKTIPRGYICDENPDCYDREDEIGCTSPQITKTSPTDISAQRGQQVILNCEATGKPLPIITWRFNWGCLKDSPRFSTRFYSKDCKTVTSSLTINDFKEGDDGIYNCEALSSRQRSFSNDFQIVLSN